MIVGNLLFCMYSGCQYWEVLFEVQFCCYPSTIPTPAYSINIAMQHYRWYSTCIYGSASDRSRYLCYMVIHVYLERDLHYSEFGEHFSLPLHILGITQGKSSPDKRENFVIVL